MMQLVTPNPDIPCKPGWCLQYVRQAFGAPVVEPTATAGWNNAKYRHEDWNFPGGCWVPVWFSLASEPAGHVALLAPDGSVYSTSDDATVPHHHPDMQDLIRYYWRNPLTYLGWSEDISGVRVVQESTISAQSETITPQEADVAFTAEQEQFIIKSLESLVQNVATKKDVASPGQVAFTEAALRSLVENVATKADLSGVSAAVASAVGAKASTEEIEAAVRAGMTAGLKVSVTVADQP